MSRPRRSVSSHQRVSRRGDSTERSGSSKRAGVSWSPSGRPDSHGCVSVHQIRRSEGISDGPPKKTNGLLTDKINRGLLYLTFQHQLKTTAQYSVWIGNTYFLSFALQNFKGRNCFYICRNHHRSRKFNFVLIFAMA